MSGNRDLFIELSCLPDIRSVSIADGRLCSEASEGIAQVSLHLLVHKVLYIPYFLGVLFITFCKKFILWKEGYFCIDFDQNCYFRTFRKLYLLPKVKVFNLLFSAENGLLFLQTQHPFYCKLCYKTKIIGER